MTVTEKSAAAPARAERGANGAVIVAALVGIYILSQFFRNTLAVIGPDLSREFDLDAAQLGLLSSIFFLAFALAQVPLGIAIDRWGPKPAMLFTAALMIGSAVLFALAADYRQLTVARLLMGFGCCSFFMAPLALYAELFRPEKFSTVTGIHIGAGSMGMLIATVPLASFTALWGWRNAFLTAAVFATIMAIVVLLFVHERAEVIEKRRTRVEDMRQTLAGVVAATRQRGFWSIFFMQGATYSAFAAVAGLWVGPWLAQTYGLGIEARGRMTLIIAVCQIAGLFFWGASDRWFQSYRRPVVTGATLSICLLALAAVVPLPAGALPVYLACFGFCLGINSVLTAHGKTLFPPNLTGRGLTLINMGTMSGAFFQQFATGLAIETFGFRIVDGVRLYPPEAFRLVFGLIAAQVALALVFYLRAPDRHPARD
ncbi:MAG: MFS transporter [Beijerinckiaceae bacterium]